MKTERTLYVFDTVLKFYDLKENNLNCINPVNTSTLRVNKNILVITFL